MMQEQGSLRGERGIGRIDDVTLENLCLESTKKGWLVKRCKHIEPYFLQVPNFSRKINLPDIPMPDAFSEFRFILVTAPPNASQGCFVFFFCSEKAKLLFCRPGDLRWTEWRYDRFEEFPFVEAIMCNDKLYVLNHLGNLREIKFIAPYKLYLKRYNATLPCERYRLVDCCAELYERYRLVDSCGELFAVGIKSIFDINVFKMDFSQDRWEKVLKLDPDRSFALMGNSSASFSATELGIKDNAIFFKETEPGRMDDDDESLYSFNLVDMSLSVWRNNNGRYPWTLHDHQMTMSALRFQNKSRSCLGEKDQTVQEESICDGDSKCVQLPLDTLMEIFQRLSSVYDWINIRAVCKSWKSLIHSVQWTYDHMGLPFEYAWFMFPHGETEGMYSLYDPISNLMHCISIPELEDCKIRFSKQGWLLVTTAPTSIFFLEPFTRTRIQLPDLIEYEELLDGFCFSDAPTSSNWQILATRHFGLVNSFFIYHLRSGEEEWHWISRRFVCESISNIPSFTNSVFHGENFCYLGKNGSVVSFKFTGAEAFEVSLSSSSLSNYWRHFLVCYQDELISVCIDQSRKTMDLFKLDDKGGEWVKIKSLDKKILYLSQGGSLVVEAIPPQMRNTVQLPMFGDSTGDNINGSNAYYSLKDQRFYINNGTQGYSPLRDLYDTKEIFLRGTWIQPVVQPRAIWI